MFNFSNTQKTPLEKLRWALLIVFPAVCISVALQSGPVPEPLIAGTVSMLSCGLLLRHLATLTSRNLAVWLALGLFLVLYFLRYAQFSFDPTPVAGIQPDAVYKLLRNDQEGLRRSFMFSAIVFSIFCVASALLLNSTRVSRGEMESLSGAVYSTADLKVARMLLLGVPVLLLLLGYVAYTYRIGQMGVSPGEPLPFRMRGVIFYARLVVLPLLILTLIYLGMRARSYWFERAGLFLLLVHGVSDMMLRGSRSSLLLSIVLAIFLAANGGLRLKRNGILIGSALLLISVWLMPVIMSYRVLRFTSNESLLAVLGQAFHASSESLSQILFSGLSVVYFRLPGLETMWAILAVSAEPLGSALIPTLTSPFGITGYLNFIAYQVPPELNTLFAPGFVGWLYLAGGMLGLVLGAIALAWICVLVPRFIFDSSLRCAPVANTFLLWILFVSLTDGTLDSNVSMIFVGLLSLGGIELLLRFFQKSAAEMPR